MSVIESGREAPRDRNSDRERERDRDTFSTIANDHQHSHRVLSGSVQGSRTSSLTRTDSRTESRGDYREGNVRYENNGHWRNNSNVSTDNYSDIPPAPTPVQRSYDYELSGNANDSGQTAIIPAPIPPPTVTVRSEFPTLTRSKVQQSLTCIVTVEVSERKHNHAEGVISASPTQQDQYPTSPVEVGPQHSFDRQDGAAPRGRTRDYEPEREEVLAGITEDLRLRVENWHGLDFSK